jgi:SAM-dependent methyltransferase
MRTEPYPAQAKAIELHSNNLPWTPAHDIRVLLWVADNLQTGDILEIGCNNGATTRELALRYPERAVIGVDYVTETPTMVSEQLYEMPRVEFGKYAVGLRNVELRNENSRMLDYSRFPNVRLVFIDGDHSYAGVKADTELALAALESSGREFPRAGAAALVWHDVYPNAPDWCQVWQYLEAEIAPRYPGLNRIEDSHVAVLVLP